MSANYWRVDLKQIINGKTKTSSQHYNNSKKANGFYKQIESDLKGCERKYKKQKWWNHYFVRFYLGFSKSFPFYKIGFEPRVKSFGFEILLRKIRHKGSEGTIKLKSSNM